MGMIKRAERTLSRTIISMSAYSQQIPFLMLRTTDIFSSQFSENQTQKLTQMTGLLGVSLL